MENRFASPKPSHALQELLDKSFPIKGKIPIAYWFDSGGLSPHYATSVVPFYAHAYLNHYMKFNYEGGVVSFVWDHSMYVTPKTDAVVDLLLSERFTIDLGLAVPFSDSSKPFIDEQRKLWERLLKEAGST